MRNGLDAMIYRVEKSLADLGDDADAALVAEVKAAVETAKPALESENVDEIKAASEELEKSTHKLAEALYNKAQQEQAAAGADAGGGPTANGADAGSDPAAGGADDDVVDADFEEMKPS